MFEKMSVNKILKRYRDKCVGELSSAERNEVLRLMAEKSDTDAVNIFVRDGNGSMSSRKMSMPIYLSHLEKTDSNLTVGEVIKKLQID